MGQVMETCRDWHTDAYCAAQDANVMGVLVGLVMGAIVLFIIWMIVCGIASLFGKDWS